LRTSRFDAFTQHDLTSRAADYFRQARKPRAEWKKLDDLAAQLAEFDLRCAAGDYDTAASVLLEIDFNYLLLWGHYRLMIDLCLRLKENITDMNLQMNNLNGLGLTHYSISKAKESVVFYEQGLNTARETKERSWERAFLDNLGNAYSALGDAHKAIDYYEQSLAIAHEIGERVGEGRCLTNLGDSNYEIGQIDQSITYGEQALIISRELQDLSLESIQLGNLGGYYIEYGDLEKSIICCLQSIQIADEINYVQVQSGTRWRLAQAYLSQNDLVNARATIETALQYDVPQYNHDASALHGVILLRMRDLTGLTESRPDGKGSDEDLSGLAAAAFVRAIGQADEILSKTAEYYSALDAKGLAICGLALCRGAVPAPDHPIHPAPDDAATTGRER
jgi:tetratricopeptide (TPR) repeat protein